MVEAKKSLRASCQWQTCRSRCFPKAGRCLDSLCHCV
nr:unnamed protein product [Callosobruchus analis]CAI5860305.1 unnamed protein product [Callosobruchus analis]